jgi:4-hydroxy-3-polyprenylbenzoate decarboxylase
MARLGVLAFKVDAWKDYTSEKLKIDNLSRQLATLDLDGIAMIILTEDDEFIGKTLNNFVWVTFTRANPSHDIYGVKTKVEHKHWGCEGPLIIDARIKTHHAPPLVKDPKTTVAVDKLFSKGGELYGVI